MAAGLKEKLDAAKETTALARPTSTVLSIFQDATIKTQLAAALGSNPALTAERMLVVALNECRRTPALLECTRASMVGALLYAAHLGLEVGGALGHVYLVPLKNTSRGVKEVNAWLGYKGMIVLARRSKEISDIAARPVYSGDYFEWEYALDDRLVHRPSLLPDRGEIVAFYGIARFVNGGRQMLVMSKSEVDTYRKRSKASGEGPWVSDYAPMGSKTVIRRMAAFLPLTNQAAEAIAEDEERELGLTPEGVLDLEALGFLDQKPSASGERKQAPKGEQGSGAEATSTSAAASPATPSEPAPGQAMGEAIAGAEERRATEAAADTTVCQICGSTDALHDDKKHAQWAKARREEKEKAAEGEGLPLDGGS